MSSTRFLSLALFAAVFSVQLNAEQPDSLPRLTPRPAATADVASPIMTLNGTWLFRTDSSTTMADMGVDQSVSWSPIYVPSEWVMQSYSVQPGTYAAYRRTFDLPGDWAGKRIKLRFDGVHSSCRVWVNGVDVGEHEGGFTVFEFDVTAQLTPGSNSITVAVKSESVADTLASASQYAAHQLGGITRKVTLFAVPELHIASLVANSVFDRQFRHADLLVDMAFVNESGQTAAPAEFVCELMDPSGEKVPVAPATGTLGSLSPGELARRSISIRAVDAKKWDPEHPNLYLLRIHVRQDGRTM
ncbi:glycoside hydrolase family 2, partial [bacterium]